MNEFSHIDKKGKAVMVDVANKEASLRKATARSVVWLPDEAAKTLLQSGLETKKGPVFNTAIIGGIMAAKKTGDLIPFCHPLGLENCNIEIKVSGSNEIVIDCTASITSKTGVEMEALVGATIAALTVYDMCKALSPEIIIKETMLIKKSGGKKDFERKDKK